MKFNPEGGSATIVGSPSLQISNYSARPHTLRTIIMSWHGNSILFGLLQQRTIHNILLFHVSKKNQKAERIIIDFKTIVFLVFFKFHLLEFAQQFGCEKN